MQEEEENVRTSTPVRATSERERESGTPIWRWMCGIAAEIFEWSFGMGRHQALDTLRKWQGENEKTFNVIDVIAFDVYAVRTTWISRVYFARLIPWSLVHTYNWFCETLTTHAHDITPHHEFICISSWNHPTSPGFNAKTFSTHTLLAKKSKPKHTLFWRRNSLFLNKLHARTYSIFGIPHKHSQECAAFCKNF